jgi:enoyl-CoA hydratase/carnithine racemase
VASEGSEFGLPELRVGLWPFYVSALLALHVSPKRAMDLMLTGDRISADQACEWGLVSRVLPDDTFAADVDALLDRIADAPRSALAMGKRTMNAMVDRDLDQSLLLMQSHLSLLSTSDEARALMQGFLDRRR